MFTRFCISALTLLAVASVSFARVAGPDMRSPKRSHSDSIRIRPTALFTPDSARISNPEAAERNKRLYDSIRSKTTRRRVPRMLYRMLFVRPVLDTTSNGAVRDESRQLEPYAGKTIGSISIERSQVFDENGNWLERAGNNTHMLTRERSSAATCSSARAIPSTRNSSCATSNCCARVATSPTWTSPYGPTRSTPHRYTSP